VTVLVGPNKQHLQAVIGLTTAAFYNTSRFSGLSFPLKKKNSKMGHEPCSVGSKQIEPRSKA